MVEVCEPLQKLTLSKVTWTWNALYQQLFAKTKSLIKADVCMKFYNDIKMLYLETDAPGVGLGAALLQLCDNTTFQKDRAPDNVILHPIAFASKSLTGAEQRYSNTEREELGHIIQLAKISSLLFWQRGTCHHQPQTISIHV